MKNKTLLLLIVFSLLLACQKDQRDQQNNGEIKTSQSSILSLSETRRWYTLQAAGNKQQDEAQNNTPSSFSLDQLKFDWNKAQSMPTKNGNYWIIALEGQPTYQQTRQGYRKLAFQKDPTGQIHAFILEIIPEGHIYQRIQKISTGNFTGSLFIYDEHYQLKNGKIYINGAPLGLIKPNTQVNHTASAQTNTLSPFEATQITQNCQWYDSNYINAEGGLVVFSQQVCTYDIDPGDSGFDAGSGDLLGNSGGGGGTSAEAPAAPNLPGENGPKIDPKKLMDCFGNVPDQGASFKVVVYVQEPWPGTSFAIGPNSVGHTAIGLTKTNGGTTITQVVGYYPDASGLSKLKAPSKILNNGGDLDYTESISYTVTSMQFTQIANYIANPPASYDLFNFNCTNFVYSACKQGSITLPDPNSVTGFNGATFTPEYSMTPGGLGSSLDKMKGQSNVNTSGGTTPNSKGPCY